MPRKVCIPRFALAISIGATLLTGGLSGQAQSPSDTAVSPIKDAAAPARAPGSSLKRIRYTAPEYPPEAFKNRLSGYVVIDFVVNTQGEPVELRVVEASPELIFDQAAMRAIKRWRYEPLIVNNVPTAVPTRATLRFEPPPDSVKR